MRQFNQRHIDFAAIHIHHAVRLRVVSETDAAPIAVAPPVGVYPIRDNSSALLDIEFAVAVLARADINEEGVLVIGQAELARNEVDAPRTRGIRRADGKAAPPFLVRLPCHERVAVDDEPRVASVVPERNGIRHVDARILECHRRIGGVKAKVELTDRGVEVLERPLRMIPSIDSPLVRDVQRRVVEEEPVRCLLELQVADREIRVLRDERTVRPEAKFGEIHRRVRRREDGFRLIIRTSIPHRAEVDGTRGLQSRARIDHDPRRGDIIARRAKAAKAHRRAVRDMNSAVVEPIAHQEPGCARIPKRAFTRDVDQKVRLADPAIADLRHGIVPVPFRQACRLGERERAAVADAHRVRADLRDARLERADQELTRDIEPTAVHVK